MIFTQGKDERKRTFMFFITESYQAVVLDFTDAKNNKIATIVKVDMRASIQEYMGYIQISELFCNELTNIDSNNTIFMYPCITNEKKFITWFILAQSGIGFKLKIFATPNTEMQIDWVGRNSYITFLYGNNIFVLSSGVDTKEYFTLTIIDVSRIQNNYVKETYYGNYTYRDFSYIKDGK